METIATPSKTKQIIQKYGFTWKKSLGQNFLVEPNFIMRILEQAAISKNDLVLEIGPGLGAMTQLLCTQAGQVIAIEIDGRLVPILQELLDGFDNLNLIHGDALKQDLAALEREAHAKTPGLNPGFVVCANLPYYVTTPIVMAFLESNLPWRQMILMVQKEVALRMQASPGSKDYGTLSVGVQFWAEAKVLATVPPTVFMPRPKVDSAIISLSRLPEPRVQVPNQADYFKVVKLAFGQRRKTLLNALTADGWLTDKAGWQDILQSAGIDAARRGETLNLEEFAQIARALPRA